MRSSLEVLLKEDMVYKTESADGRLVYRVLDPGMQAMLKEED